MAVQPGSLRSLMDQPWGRVVEVLPPLGNSLNQGHSVWRGSHWHPTLLACELPWGYEQLLVPVRNLQKFLLLSKNKLGSLNWYFKKPSFEMQNQILHLVWGTDLLPALSTGKEKILSYRILKFKYLPPGIHQGPCDSTGVMLRMLANFWQIRKIFLTQMYIKISNTS